jgi:hypothetical protein
VAKQNYFLAASRLVPYKNIHAIVAAFHDMSQEKLMIAGEGPDAQRFDHARFEREFTDYVRQQQLALDARFDYAAAICGVRRRGLAGPADNVDPPGASTMKEPASRAQRRVSLSLPWPGTEPRNRWTEAHAAIGMCQSGHVSRFMESRY